MQSNIVSQSSQNQRIIGSQQTFSNNKDHPKKQQWAIIYNQQALQNKQIAVVEKQINRQKMEQFKSELEKQLNIKNEQHQLEKEEDKKFSQYIRNKASQQQMHEKNEKLRKMLEVRRVDRENYEKMEEVKRLRALQNDMGASGLVIGQKSDLQVKQQRYMKRRQLTDALDKQLKLKQQERYYQKQSEYEKDNANKQYMNQYYQKRQLVGPRRRQNQEIYHYFQRLNQQKAEKQRQLQKKLVDDAIVKKQLEEARKQQQKNRLKQYAQYEVKQTIEDQLRYKSEQNLKQKKYNPEQNSYQIIGNIFRQRKDAYDKKKYFEFLSQQAQQQSRRKKSFQYMNQQEYKLNMNQLNKAVNGKYEHQNYIDRTVNSIGVNRAKAASSMSLDLGRRDHVEQDAILVKNRLDEIRRQGGQKYEKSNISFHL